MLHCKTRSSNHGVVRGRGHGPRLAPERLESRVLLSTVSDVAGLTLLNADTGQPVSGVPLTNSATIDLGRAGHRLSVRAELTAGAAGSVRFNYDGDPAYRVDDAAPYDINGDSRHGSTYLPWLPAVGTHELIATAYSGQDGTGDRGNPMAVTFNVIDSSPAPSPVRVNAGGPRYLDASGELFASDSGFHGGARRTSATFAPTGTADPTLFQTWREGESFKFSTNLPDGVYTVSLYFADPLSTGPGMREFDVFANGQPVLDHYDIAADVGPKAAAVKTFQVTSLDGDLDLKFRGEVGKAIVSAVQVIAARTPSDPAPVYANAGGLTYIDSLNRHFDSLGFAGGTEAQAPTPLANTPDAPLFDNYRTGSSFAFSRAMAPGNYELFLDFVEPTFTQPGERVFDVSAGGQTLLDHYDIVQDAGASQPDVKAFAIHVGNGPFSLAFQGDVGDAIVSSIVLIPTDVSPAAMPYSSNGASDPVKRLQDISNLRVLGMDLGFWANAQTRNGNKFPDDLNALAAGGYVDRLVQLADPRSSTAPPRGELSHAEGLAWVRTLNDYVYLGKGKQSLRVNANTIMAYENPDRVTGDIDVLFGDEHVGTLTRAQLSQDLGMPVGDPTHAPPPAVSEPGGTPDPMVLASAAHLSAVGQLLEQYAADQPRNFNRFPPDLATLVANSDATASTFVNPREPNPVQPPTLTRDQLPAWVTGHSDYVYVGAHKRASSPADTLLAYENPAAMKGGLLMLFADGRVEFREMRWALETIARDQSMPIPR
jgi:hypothetical protein